jgi:hypothetical protein
MEGTPQEVLTKDVAFDMVAMAVRKCTKLIRDMVSARKQAESCADAMYEEEEYAYVHFQKCFEHYDEVIDTVYERMRFLLRNQHVGAYRVIYEDREGDLHIHGIFRNKEDAEKYADAMHSTLGHRLPRANYGLEDVEPVDNTCHSVEWMDTNVVCRAGLRNAYQRLLIWL